MKKILTLLILVVLTKSIVAQFSISGEFRPRAEFHNGYKKLSDSSKSTAAFVSQRSRINFNYSQDKIKTSFSLQDVRIWGEDKIKKDIAGIALHEVWIEYTLSENFALKLGRQAIKYDNQRIMGAANWNQISTKHDALVLKYKNKTGLNIDLVSAFNQDTLNSFGTNYTLAGSQYKTMNVLWISKKFDKLKLSTLNVADGFQKVGASEILYLRVTTSGIVEYNTDKLGFSLRAYKQLGTDKKGTEISAHNLNADIIYKLSKKSKINLGFESMSGNDALDTANTMNNAFDILYGGKHGFNGTLDYFSTPSTTKNSGFNDIYLKATLGINEKTSFKFDYHLFTFQNNFAVDNEAVDKYLGSEIDLGIKYTMSKEANIMFGYSIMFASESMELIKGGDSSEPVHWAFIMLAVKPKFFTSE